MTETDDKLHRKQPTTLQRARDLRTFMSPYERTLWTLLKNRQINGLKFRRQHPIDPYVVDFYCADARLVIELDGDSHQERRGYDAQRTAYLTDKGYRVIRFTNEQIKNACEDVVSAILKACTNLL